MIPEPSHDLKDDSFIKQSPRGSHGLDPSSAVPPHTEGHSGNRVRPFAEIKAAGLEEYYHFFISRLGKTPITEDMAIPDPEWIAMNETSYKFLEDKGLEASSVEYNNFIHKMLI